MADQVVGFAATLGSVTATAKSDGAGVAQAVLTSAQQVGQARVTATLGSLTAAADVTFAGRLVSGSIYADLNGNGMRESDEPGLGGIDVEITLAALAADAGEAQASAGSTWHARSDAEGVYAFADLPLGEYNVTVHLPVGFTSTTPATFTVTVGAGPAAAPAVGAIAHVFLPGVAR